MSALLIVDDEPNVLNALRRLCRNASILPAIAEPAITTFTSPYHALKHLDDHVVDIVITNCRMPDMVFGHVVATGHPAPTWQSAPPDPGMRARPTEWPGTTATLRFVAFHRGSSARLDPEPRPAVGFDARRGCVYKGRAGSSSNEIAGPPQPLPRHSAGHHLLPLTFPRPGPGPDIQSTSLEQQK